MPPSPGALCAWLYDVDHYGKSRPTWPNAPQPMKIVPPGAILHVAVSVDSTQDSPTQRYLKAPPAEGMASEPVTVGQDTATGYWTIRNSGRTNTLRVQQYGLSAVPLRPQAAISMAGQDVAVWIPVVPRAAPHRQSEAFRLLILAAPEPRGDDTERPAGTKTKLITVPRRFLSPNTQEALVAYFGDHLSWPPLPAPHVRQQKEVEEIAVQHGLAKAQAHSTGPGTGTTCWPGKTACSPPPTGTRGWADLAARWRITSPPSTGSSSSARSRCTAFGAGRRSRTWSRT